jgi:D-alanyl-lipoteichoic acid acyltransferase DltB (MBOAT superfamily)
MVFSSIIFIFGYLPVVLAGSFLLRKKIQAWNIFLFFMSLCFYAYGEPDYIVLLLFIIIFNWGSGLVLHKFLRYRKLLLFITVLSDVLILFFVKYYSWIIQGIYHKFGLELPLQGSEIRLPIGISFFTFQAISYVVDVYYGNVKPQKAFEKIGLYVSLFPQLIAGPIVRYTDIEKQMENRVVSVADLSDGLERFFMGLSKKVLLADNMAVIADKAFLMCKSNSLGMLFAWLGAFAYTFQIYFDFSGYSDMAIGLGRMLGFTFPENFKDPYRATSIKDFWRKWHISLSSWFRDYVYIPLGGNRKGRVRTYINLLIVWTLTGLWHGANLSYLIWGGSYAVCILIENFCHMEGRTRSPLYRVLTPLYRGMTFFIVMLLWVVFRAENISQAMLYIRTMFEPGQVGESLPQTILYLSEYKIEFVICVFLSFVKLPQKVTATAAYHTGKVLILWMFFLMSISYLVKGSYSPFIYFNF